MGKVIVQDYTYRDPITMIGAQAGICYDADTSSREKNFKRGLECLQNQHGRTLEFPDVYLVLEGYSARVIREWYTHIGGAPTRLQASTRYINYEHGFEYVTPPSIKGNVFAEAAYTDMMDAIRFGLETLDTLGIPREDSAMGLPLGMTTKIVCKHNVRNLIDMSHQRMCTRAYHEYRDLFRDVCNALKSYSEEYAYIVDHYFVPKCEYMGFCTEKRSCGRKPGRAAE